MILFHDTANEQVRAGIDAVDFDAHAKVVHVEPDFVAGSLFSDAVLENEIWGGLGLVIVDASRTRSPGASAVQQRIVPTATLLREARDRRLSSPLDARSGCGPDEIDGAGEHAPERSPSSRGRWRPSVVAGSAPM